MTSLLPQRIQEKIQICSEGCWLWTAYRNEDGYGVVAWKGKSRRVHRVVYSILVKEQPDDHDTHHRCPNRHCCNPAHLDSMPKKEHSKISPGVAIIAAKNKAKTHCPHGHPWDEKNTAPGARGSRRCRRCHVIEVTKARLRKKLAQEYVP